eukprot:TRINITY_DN195_c0_g1_i6.p1 TRINITY_DN195_c0_g1~~TRINITY_DN195_c0_g1_i6.p1  ORF type:complete len:174 (-),score=13.52 TRINITY_DN195_c0_g1_i6:581-1102(-)
MALSTRGLSTLAQAFFAQMQFTAASAGSAARRPRDVWVGFDVANARGTLIGFYAWFQLFLFPLCRCVLISGYISALVTSSVVALQFFIGVLGMLCFTLSLIHLYGLAGLVCSQNGTPAHAGQCQSCFSGGHPEECSSSGQNLSGNCGAVLHQHRWLVQHIAAFLRNVAVRGRI